MMAQTFEDFFAALNPANSRQNHSVIEFWGQRLKCCELASILPVRREKTWIEMSAISV